jgi:hypothetical protein
VADAPPLVVFHAEDPVRPDVVAAREGIVRSARAVGATVLDVSPPAPAPPAAPALLRRAVEDYDALRYDDALRALNDALEEAGRTGASGLSRTDLSDLLLYRALVHTQRGNAMRAWEDLIRAVNVHPGRVLDPLRFPPSVVSAHQRAAREVATARRGTLAVEAPGCRTTVDGAEIPAGGTTTVAYGEHWVGAACPGAPRIGAVVELAEPSRVVPLSPVRAPPPGEADVRRLARERGAQRVLSAMVVAPVGGPATVTLSLIDTERSGARVETQVVSLEAAESAVRRVIDRAMAVAVPPIVPAPTRPAERHWYQSPWLWGGVGAAVAAGILVPLLMKTTPAAGVDVRPQGALPWQ